MIGDPVYNVVDSTWTSALHYQHLLAITTANRELDSWFPNYIRSALQAEKEGDECGYNLMAWMPPEDATGECLLTDKDRGDPEVWRKLNPSWGVTVGLSEMEDMYKRAKLNSHSMMEFRIKRINEWGLAYREQLLTPAEARKICDSQFDAFVKENLRKYPCAIGVDVAMVNDLAAVAVIGNVPEVGLVGEVHGFLSKASYDARVNSGTTKVFEKFADQGDVHIVGTKTHDWKAIKNTWKD